MQFFVDAMLGNIAKKLRLFGYDAEYYSDIEDSELIKKSKNEQRIIISRDKQLVDQGEKNGIVSVYISKEKEVEQFLEIINKIDLKLDEISGENARCTKCNSTTSQIDKSKIKNDVPQGVLDFNEKFWKCNNCNQVYWEGTHIKNLQDFVKKVNS